MGLIKERNEVEDKYKWDLKVIYKSNNEFNKDIKEIEKDIKNLSKYKDVMTKSGKDLYNATKAIFDVSRRINKVGTYASLKYNENITDNTSLDLLNKAENLEILFNNVTSFYDPILLKLDYKDIEKMYLEYPKLKDYEIFLKKSFRYKKYMLDEKEEELISRLAKTFSDNETIFSNLTASDIDFGKIKNECDQDVQLTDTSYSLYVKSRDRRVRRDAFIGLYSTYGRYKTTFTNLLDGLVKNQATFNKIRGYKSSLDAAMYHDELDTKVYDSLIESVSNGLEPLFKYYRIKREIMGLPDLHIYDTYADVINKYHKNYTYQDAQKIILDTLSVFGDDYVSNIKRAFDERWIDVMPNVGKTGGAFSGGGYDTYPYILTNFQGEYSDVSTLIHELGHSMHSYYSKTNNDYLYSHYSIVVAEVASTVNELLLAYHVINNSNNPLEKLYILDRLMSLFKGTIYRQTMYEEFERYIYSKADKDEVLLADDLCDYFYKLNQKYYGDSVVLDDVIKYEWERMPHLYYNFYMYKYATGLSAASQIVTQILNKEPNAVENYLKFLKTGSTMAPNEELKINGVDLTSKTVCDNAIKMFSDIVDLFEKTYKEYKKSSGDING